MNIQHFIDKYPYLYHLTDRGNYPNVLQRGRLLSTSSIVNMSDLKDKQAFLRSRRPDHTSVIVDGIEHKIRDQRPISEKVLARSLTHDWTNEDFIEHLNRRVFMWPNLNRLVRHYDRYVSENPIILRFDSAEILALNSTAEFCRLNSGATRCSSHWGGNAPERGPNTFLTAENYDYGLSSIAEVTFPDYCLLPNTFWIGNSPDGQWSSINR